ncbi:MAG TPA: response regulator [Chthoniobacteraceae bacterium]|nr:response regulator [Chthoniobacteraceae bacterium]
MNILLADDETSTTEPVSFVLRRSGHDVDVVHDGEDALSALKKNPDRYQLLVTDHLMNKISGLELVDLVRKTNFRGKIVVLSAFLTGDLEASYRKLGADRFISKPFELADLRRAVAEAGGS